jgi:phospholipid transport system substrate-binding protein
VSTAPESKMSQWIHSLLVAASLLGATPAFAADLRAQTARLLEFWTGRTQTGKAIPTEKLPADVVASFDYETFATAAIEPHKAQFSATQLQKYRQVFDQLLRKTVHRQAGAALGDTRYSVGAAQDKGDRSVVEVKAHIPKDDLDTTVQFVWAKKAEAFRIVDVVIDGSSLVKDYSNQFGRIIKKDGVGGLLAKLEKRLSGAGEESARL